jgi:hypothetical protein
VETPLEPVGPEVPAIDDRHDSGIPFASAASRGGRRRPSRHSPGWFLMWTVRVAKPGHFVIHGPEVAYRSGGRNGVVQMANTLTVDAG